MSLIRIMNDDPTANVSVVRPSSYGYAQPDATRKSHKRKHPIGFVKNESKAPKRTKR